MQMDQIQVELKDMTVNANVVKENVLGRLLKDGVITEEQAQIYSENWQVIVIKRSWYKRWFDKYLKGEDGGWQYKYVKFQD